MNTLPKFFSAALATLILATAAIAQDSRTWTSADGRTIEGVLLSKNADGVEVRLRDGRTVNLRLDALSEGCREYVATTAIRGAPRMTARTVALRSNEAGTKHDTRILEVSCSHLGDEELEIVVIWLGDAPGSGKYGVWKTEKAVASNGLQNFRTVYDGPLARHGSNFRGWVAGLRDAKGKWIVRTASMKPYERFLDEQP
jgi:hypothetical protein